MRNLLYKNLTNLEKKRRIIVTAETNDKEGIRSVVRRHFACMVSPIKSVDLYKPTKYIYVIKKRDTKLRQEHFYCKIKGSLLAVSKNSLLHIQYIHTLSVQLCPTNKLTGQIG